MKYSTLVSLLFISIYAFALIPDEIDYQKYQVIYEQANQVGKNKRQQDATERYQIKLPHVTPAAS